MFKLKKYVMEVARTGSFSQAANNLFLSQPSLSASIKRLEESIGEPLFDRTSYPVRLTRCGEEYVMAATQIELVEADFTAFLDGYRSSDVGKLTIGGSHLSLSYMLPPLLKSFIEKHPMIEVNLVESRIDQLKKMLMEGQIDLLIDGGDADPELFSAINYKPFMLVLAVPAEFPCNESIQKYALDWWDIKKDVHLSKNVPLCPLRFFDGVPFLSLTPETYTYQSMNRFFQEQKFEPKTIMSFGQQSTAFNMACNGLGMTFISDLVIKSSPLKQEMRFYKVYHPGQNQYVKFFQKIGRRESYVMQSFLKFAQQESQAGRT